MKNIGKGKILKIVICALCVLIFASAFLAVRRWLHSEGVAFYYRLWADTFIKKCVRELTRTEIKLNPEM